MSVFTIQAFQFSKQILFITACMLALNQLAGQNSCFSLKFSTEYAQQGDTVVIDVAVNGFTQIESYQFAIKWDPADLEYVKYSSVGAPISFQLFNPNAALTQGLFRTLWYDIDVAGVTLPDASVLFRLYLKVKTATPGFYPVACDPDNNPTQFSFFASGGGYKDLSHVVGGVLTGIPSSGLQIDTICANSPNCSGQNGSIQVGLQGGQAPFQYEWSGPNGFTSNQPSIFESGGGRYGLTVTDAAGNVAQAVAQLRPYTSSVNITFENTQKARCNLPNGCAVLTVTGNAPPYTVNWGDNGSTDLERCDLTPGTHWVTATNNQGCSTAMEVVIEKDSLMWVKIDSINADCRIDQPGGATVSTNGTGPFQYKWSTGATTPSIAGIYPGNYKVTVIDSNGCVGFDEAVVRDYGTFDWAISTYYLPNYNYFPELPGSSAHVTLSSSTIKDRAEFPLTISWSQGSTSNLEKKQITSNHILDRQFNLPNGLYHVTVTDAEGCSEVRPASVLLPKPSPELPEEFEYNLPRFLIKDLNSNANLDSCVEVSGSNLAYLDKVNFGIGWSFWGPEFKSVEVVHPSVNYNLNFTVNSNWLDFHWESTTFSLSSAVPLFKLCFESQEASAFNNFIRFRRGYSTPRMVHETEGDLGFIGVNGQVNYGSGSLDYSTFSGARLFQPSCEADGYRRIALDEPDYQYVVANGAIDNVNFYDDDQFLFAKAGEYTVQKSIGNSYFSELYAYIPPYSLPTSECVWPGDADNNNVVNHFDLLYLGLGIGAGHEPRLNGDEIWQGDDSNDWPQSTARRHINFKNLDTNGDGLINQSDTSAIYKHWAQAIRKFDRTSPWALPAPLDTVMEQTGLELLADTISTGTTVLIPVSLSASGIQGLAFSISYDSSLIADAPRFIPASSWLGTPGNLLDVQKDFPGQSRLDVAITRINQFAVSGSGVIGHIEFKYKLLPADSLLKTHLFATRVIAITPDEQLIGFSDTRKPVILKGGVVSGVLGDSRGLGEFKVSPNPASDVVWVESVYELIDRIEVIHVGGAILSKISPDFPSQNVAVKLDFLPSGVYFLKLFCKNNVFLTRIVKGSE